MAIPFSRFGEDSLKIALSSSGAITDLRISFLVRYNDFYDVITFAVYRKCESVASLYIKSEGRLNTPELRAELLNQHWTCFFSLFENLMTPAVRFVYVRIFFEIFFCFVLYFYKFLMWVYMKKNFFVRYSRTGVSLLDFV